MIQYVGFVVVAIIVTLLVLAQLPKGRNSKRLDFTNN